MAAKPKTDRKAQAAAKNDSALKTIKHVDKKIADKPKASAAKAVSTEAVVEKPQYVHTEKFAALYKASADEALTSGAQSSNRICAIVEDASAAGKPLTVKRFMEETNGTNKALQNLGYAVAAGNWKIAGVASPGSIKRADKEAQRIFAKKIVATHGAKQIVCVNVRNRRSTIGS